VKFDKRFPLQVAVTLVVGLAIGFGLMKLTRTDSAEIFSAVIVGAVLSTVNVMAGFLAIEYTLEKSYTTFLKGVLGGMGIRMAVMLGVIVLLIKFGGIHIVGLVVSVLSFYAVYLVLEILYIQKKVSHKSQS
jgi:hypothetical protein